MTGAVLIAFAALLAAAGPEAADTLVRGGEHGAYSRIVIPDAPDGWSAASQDRTLEIRLPQQQGYDLSEIVRKRAAHRILNARQMRDADGVVLVFQLSCSCVATSAVSGDGALVIDIRAPASGNDGGDSEQAALSPEPKQLAAARERMIALLSKASDTGVVQLKAADNPPTQETLPSVTPVSLAAESMSVAGTPAQSPCPDTALFEGQAEDDGIAYETIMALQAQLDGAQADRRDALDLALAKAYLQLGFFREAQSAATASADSPELALIEALASLAETPDHKATTALAAYRHCGAAYELFDIAARNENVALEDRHWRALDGLIRPLKAVLAERLALAALDTGDSRLAARFYRIIDETGFDSPGMTILKAAVGGEAQQALEPVAQSPGPHQARALTALAADPDAGHYEGFLDDLAELEATGRAAQDGEPDFVIAARRLATEGRLADAFDLLARHAARSSAASEAAVSAAGAFLTEAIEGADTKRKLEAADRYFAHRRELADAITDASVARLLAGFGAVDAVKMLLEDATGASAPDVRSSLALALYRAGRYARAADAASHEDAADLHLAATERAGDPATIENALRKSPAAPERIADTAWRAGAWELAADSYSRAERLDPDGAERAVLASLSANRIAAPGAAIKAIDDDERAAALRRMFVRAPRFDPRRIDQASDFASNVAEEIAFLEQEIGDE